MSCWRKPRITVLHIFWVFPAIIVLLILLSFVILPVTLIVWLLTLGALDPLCILDRIDGVMGWFVDRL
jgi:hypothetical protein